MINMINPGPQYQDAIIAALRGDATLTAFLTTAEWTKRKVLTPPVPPGTPAPYITLADSTDSDRSFFAKDSRRGECFIHGWAMGRYDVLKLYQHLYRILHRNNLMMTDGLKMNLAQLEQTMMLEDPATEGLWHVVARHSADFR